MIDEMMMLLESVQVEEVNKKAYHVKSFVERGDEATAPTRQITGDKDLLSSSELDEIVTNAIEIGQMQQAEFVTAVYRKCSRHQGVPPRTEVGRHIRAKPRASRLMIPARRPFSFTRVCEVVYIAGDGRKLCCRTS